MRKIITYLLLNFVLSLLITSPLLAAPKQESTPSSEPISTPSATAKKEKDVETKIKELKERVATRVAQLREENKRAIFGLVKEGTKESLVLKTSSGEITIKLEEGGSIVHAVDGRRIAARIADIDVGEQVLAVGTLDEEGNLLVKRIIAKRADINLNGVVAEVDTKEGTITVKIKTGEDKLVDVETITKIMIWEKGTGLTKSGLSKIKVSDRVHVNGYEKMADKTKLFIAKRILVLPGLALGITGGNPALPTAGPITSSASPKISPTVTPSAE